MLGKFIFRFDKSYPEDGEYNEMLNSRDGMVCKADIRPNMPLRAMTIIEFEDGYIDAAFRYELEEIHD